MTTYTLTRGDDAFKGGDGADTFDGRDYAAYLGKDVLTGGKGDDRLILQSIGENYWYYFKYRGSFDGGEGTDTVEVNGSFFTSIKLSNVEILEIRSFDYIRSNPIIMSLGQLSQFWTVRNLITDPYAPKQLQFELRGSGGKLDLGALFGDQAVSVGCSYFDKTNAKGVTFIGTSGDDSLAGTEFKDVLDGAKGNDFLSSGSRDSIVRGGEGDDTFIGRGHIDGGPGRDAYGAFNLDELDIAPVSVEVLRISGYMRFSPWQLGFFETVELVPTSNAVTFVVTGKGGDVDLSKYFGTHAVTVNGTDVTSRGIGFHGSNQDDEFLGSKFDDRLFGGGGADKFSSTAGKDTLKGEAGDDLFMLEAAADGLIDGGSGADRVFVRNHPSGFSDLGNVAFRNVETLQLESGVKASIAQISAFRTLLSAAVISDSVVKIGLQGGGGALDLSRFDPGLRFDVRDLGVTSGYTLSGGVRHDTLAGSRFDDAINGNRGGDTLRGGGGNDRLDGGRGEDTLDGGDGRDLLIGGGDGDKLSGGSGEDRLEGGDGDDRLEGGSSGDVLDGGAGNDRLDGNTGRDRMAGGAGDDVYVVDSRRDTIVEVAKQGFDTIVSGMSFSLKGIANVEALALSGTRALEARGDKADDTLVGNGAGSTLRGLDGKDTLIGGSGDRLFGGKGDDNFAFVALPGSTGGAVLIEDFGKGDFIALRADVFGVADDEFISTRIFKDLADGKADADDRLLYDSRTGDLFFDQDGSGSQYAAVRLAQLKGRPALDADDVFGFP